MTPDELQAFATKLEKGERIRLYELVKLMDHFAMDEEICVPLPEDKNFLINTDAAIKIVRQRQPLSRIYFEFWSSGWKSWLSSSSKTSFAAIPAAAIMAALCRSEAETKRKS